MSLSRVAAAELDVWTLDSKTFRIQCNFASATHTKFWAVLINPETKGNSSGALLENRKGLSYSKRL